MSNQTTFLDTFKSGSKRFATLVADTGAKTMLKVRLLCVCVYIYRRLLCSCGLLNDLHLSILCIV